MTDRPETITASGSSPPQLQNRDASPRWLLPVIVWQAVLGVAALLGAVLVVTGALWDLSGLANWIVAALLVIGAFVAGLGVRDSLAAKHRGRAIGVILNYLVVILFGFAGFQNMGVFRGLDALGDNFFNVAWVLVIVAVGWVLATQAERFGGFERNLRLAGRVIAGVGAVWILLEIGRAHV